MKQASALNAYNVVLDDRKKIASFAFLLQFRNISQMHLQVIHFSRQEGYISIYKFSFSLFFTVTF